MNEKIVAKNISKIYRVYHSPLDRLQYFFRKSNPDDRYFTEFYALKNVSFTIREGESVGIIGCNGSGKSTLLQLVASILKPSSGTINVHGRVAALLELGSGFNPEFTGKENVYFNATLLGLSKQEIKHCYQRIIDFADIGEFIDRPVRTYSSGMMIRLAFSVMIHVSPEIIIIDEALTVGDIFFQQKCIRYLKENFAHKTKIFVAHEMSLISSLCHRVLYLEKGVLKFDGDVAAGIEAYLKAFHSTERQVPSPIPASPHECIDWTPIPEHNLSGQLEMTILAIQISVNQCPISQPKILIRHQDRVDFKMQVYSSKPNVKTIFGYLVSDHLGNMVFGQNAYQDIQFYTLSEPGYYIAHYTFLWPDVTQGQYTLTPGIGEGEEPLFHMIQCWAHRVCVFECISPHAVHGGFNHPLTYFEVVPQAQSSSLSPSIKKDAVHDMA